MIDEHRPGGPGGLPAAAPITPAALFGTFFLVALSAFGGALFWARRMIVEERRWLSADEFLELLSLCQLLPGPNVLNLAVAAGARFCGIRGALAAALGLIAVPFVLMLCLGALYARYGHSEALGGAFAGVAAAAAGLVVAMTAKMAGPLLRRRSWTGLTFAALAFVASALLGWPLPWVLLVLAPASVYAALKTRGP